MHTGTVVIENFGFHKWGSAIYGLNRLDLHSIIRLRRTSFYRHVMLQVSPCAIFTSAKDDYVFVVVCLSVCLLATLHENFGTDLRAVFREGWQWASEHMIKFRWRAGSPSGYRDCFPDSSLLGDTESR